MFDLLSIFAVCSVLGCIVGFLAGLLGIGGGLLIVPTLSTLLLVFGVVDAQGAMLTAIATSLASIIVTSSSSALAHHKANNVPWDVAPWVLIGVACGALLSGFFAERISTDWLKGIFACSVIFIAFRMLSPSKAEQADSHLPNNFFLASACALIGGLSGLIGIGGGALLVPFLNHFGLALRRAIGCAAVSGILIALFGTLGFVVSGWDEVSIKQGFIGYVYLPALFGIVVTSVFFAQLGVKANQRLPVTTIKRVFACLLMLVALKMIFF